MQDGEEAFLNFRRVVESANVIMATYADEQLGDTAVSTSEGMEGKPAFKSRSISSAVFWVGVAWAARDKRNLPPF